MNQPNDRLSQSPLDEHLKQLAIAAQQHPKKSKARQHALAKLLSTIQQSGRLSRPRRDQFQGMYEEIYDEARQRLFSFICEKIDDYSPIRGEVLQWANFLLSQRFFIEASRDVMPTIHRGVGPGRVKRLTLDDLDRNNPIELNPQLTPTLSQQVEQSIEEDPEGIFTETCITNYPTASFKTLALKRLSGYSWQEISTELGISIPTLSSFYQRCLTKFAPKLKEYLL